MQRRSNVASNKRQPIVSSNWCLWRMSHSTTGTVPTMLAKF